MSDDAFPLPGTTAIQTVADWENFFHPAFSSGVVPDIGSALAPSLDASGRHIVMATGAAIVRAFYKPVSAATYTAIPAASSQNRIDRLVLRLNRAATTGPTFVQPTVIQGTPASSPQVPALTRTLSGLWDLPIAHWTSAANGSLTGLVDERVMTAAVASATSAGGTPVLDRPGLLIQPDTGALLLSTAAGAAWKTVWTPPDTWHDGGSAANGFTFDQHPSTYFSYKMVAPSLVAVTFSGNVPRKAPGGVQILASALPAAYRPVATKSVAAYTDLQEVADSAGHGVQTIVSIHSNGTVTARGLAANATTISGNGVYPTDSPY